VAEYARYRPGYPDELFLKFPGSIFTPITIVADIGCGTGIFTSQTAGRVKKVFAVEPNTGMREYARRSLSSKKNVEVLAGRAEETGLGDNSVDVITAAQAFHWFDRDKTRPEFRRIIKPGGTVVLVWYKRQTTGDEFLEGYERLMLEYSIDYQQVDHRNITPEIIAEFFDPHTVETISVRGDQPLDFAGVRGRVISSSYAPGPDNASFEPLMRELKVLFDNCRRDGRVSFRYDFIAHISRIGSLHDGSVL